jgi:hypothetical protein
MLDIDVLCWVNVVCSLHDIAGKTMLILALNNKNAPFKIDVMSKCITISRTKYDFFKRAKNKVNSAGVVLLN